MEALVVLMTGPVTGTDLVRLWAAAAVAATLPLRMMITTIAAVLLVVTALAGMTTVAAPPRANSTIDVREDMVVMVVRRLVAAWRLMSMAHRAHDTLTILTIPGPAHRLVATTTPT
jgi:hypothetical protein